MGITVFEATDFAKAATALTDNIAATQEAKNQAEAFSKELGEENLFGVRHYAGGFTEGSGWRPLPKGRGGNPGLKGKLSVAHDMV